MVLNLSRLKKVRQTLSAHHSRDRHFLSSISKQIMETELWPWRCLNCQRINKKQAMKCVVCAAHWTSGTRHSTQPKPQQQHSQNASWAEWGEWSREWDEWEDAEDSRRWDRSQARSHSQASTKSAKSDAYQNQKSHKGKRNQKKGQGKGGRGKAKDSANASMLQSPFTPLASELPPWPSLEGAAANLMPSVATSSSPFTAIQANETIAQKREVVSALKTAYTDSAQMPQDTRDLIAKMETDIEKLEKEHAKATTKNLHSATTALGKAQKTLTETLEAKRVHRARWTKHVAEAAKTWEGQLHQYRQQQASLQETAAKARADIEGARNAIQALSSKATQATLAAMPPITAVTAETEDLTLDPDNEEEAMQQQLQTVLQSCAASLGLDLAAQGQQKKVTEMMSEDDASNLADQNRQKRPRSLEPFGGGVQSVPAATEHKAT